MKLCTKGIKDYNQIAIRKVIKVENNKLFYTYIVYNLEVIYEISLNELSKGMIVIQDEFRLYINKIKNTR